MTGNEKRRVSLRYWLLGKEYYLALSAMEFAAGFHTGLRKDGVTPEFDHQISIAHLVRSLPNLLHQEESIAVAFLHDVAEDYGVSHLDLKDRFGLLVADAVWRLTKIEAGIKRPTKPLFTAMSQCPISSIVKGCDRDHNFRSMIGVFTPEKQISYIDEAEQYFFPMLKAARRCFPQQEAAYEIIKQMLRTQVTLVRALHVD